MYKYSLQILAMGITCTPRPPVDALGEPCRNFVLGASHVADFVVNTDDRDYICRDYWEGVQLIALPDHKPVQAGRGRFAIFAHDVHITDDVWSMVSAVIPRDI